MTQRWRCELCKVMGSVRFKENAGVWEVVMRIQDQHERKRKPHCAARMSNLRLIDDERVKE